MEKEKADIIFQDTLLNKNYENQRKQKNLYFLISDTKRNKVYKRIN